MTLYGRPALSLSSSSQAGLAAALASRFLQPTRAPERVPPPPHLPAVWVLQLGQGPYRLCRYGQRVVSQSMKADMQQGAETSRRITTQHSQRAFFSLSLASHYFSLAILRSHPD